MSPDDEKPIADEPPPVFKTWPRVYVFVLCYVAAVIAAFYWFTVHFAP